MTRLDAEHVPGGLWVGARVVQPYPVRGGAMLPDSGTVADRRGVLTGTGAVAWDDGTLTEPDRVALELTHAPTLTELVQRVAASVGLPVGPLEPWGVALYGGLPCLRQGGHFVRLTPGPVLDALAEVLGE